MVDAKILAEVYLQLKGGREQKLVFEAEVVETISAEVRQRIIYLPRPQRPAPLPALITAEEAAAHAEFIEGLGAEALWRKVS